MTGDHDSRAPALRVEGLAKTFGEGEGAVRAVDGISLSVDHGEVVGVLGPNGAGKTTTIKSMLGLVLPDDGTVEVCGIDVHDEPAAAYRHVDAMLEGARNVYWRLTVEENLRYFAGLGGDDPDDLTDRHERLLESLGLADEADTVVNDLSRGMKQKVSLASTLARDVDVVFLDEPTLGLDVESSIELRSELRRLAERENVTIVLCSHDMNVIEAVCDRIVILQDGRVIADDPMADLVDVLREKRFSVVTDGPIDEDLERDLADRFGATIRESDPSERGGDTEVGQSVTIDATGIGAEDAAALLDAVRDAGHSLQDVETAEPTLEDVFLRVTGTGDGGDGDGSEPGGNAHPSGSRSGDANGSGSGDANGGRSGDGSGDESAATNDDPEPAAAGTGVIADGDR
ncbi:multidrug ABC transporter ATPase [Salinarchaeum sp. Harcht-Bsk1]|uniref:ABC transporter ATP-binding protein n=1 Tax=Salinarchaeum sp. Harcht-Bsk1 TaxID=1333523 RepID=UPI00034243A5|nr:ABC transporter ATP-binding protein [Salinarchaeum sp. Harcht-Bsk1]AGN00753.1 multidrug ABC transporter ATPase [Salinarchaeum sp. Harcht-Bsk1]